MISQGAAVSQKMLTKRCVNVYARVYLSAPAIHSCLVPPTSAPHYCRPYFYTETATLPLMTERKLLLRLSLCIVPRRKESHPKLVCGHYYVVTVHNSQQMVRLFTMSISDPMHICSPHVRNSTLLYSVSSKTIQTKTNVAVTGGSPPLLLFTPKYLPHRRILGMRQSVGVSQTPLLWIYSEIL